MRQSGARGLALRTGPVPWHPGGLRAKSASMTVVSGRAARTLPKVGSCRAAAWGRSRSRPRPRAHGLRTRVADSSSSFSTCSVGSVPTSRYTWRCSPGSATGGHTGNRASICSKGSLTSEGLYGCALWGEAEGNEASQLVSVWQPVYGGQPVLAPGVGGKPGLAHRSGPASAIPWTTGPGSSSGCRSGAPGTGR